MRVIITGGTGLIGRALVGELIDHGHEPVVLSRNPAKTREIPGEVDLVEWDARSVNGWVEEVNRSEAIVNLAGENIAGAGFLPERWTEDKKSRILNSRLRVGRAVNKAVAEAEDRPSVVVQSSAVGYYGTDEEKEFTESSPPGVGWLAEVAKQWEKVTEPVEELGIRRVVIRTGIVLSGAGGVLPRLLLPYQLFLGGPIGNGGQWYSWIHIRDEVRAIRFLLENEAARGPFNLTAPNPSRNREFGDRLGRVLGRPSALRVPGLLVRLALGEASSMVLEGQKVLPVGLEDLGFEYSFPALPGALEDLVAGS